MPQTELFHQNRKGHEKKPGQVSISYESEKGQIAGKVSLFKREIISMMDGAKTDEQRAREEQEATDPESGREAPTTPPYSIFTRSQKRYIVFLAAFAGLFSPLSANIYFPALNKLATDLRVSNANINLTLTSYMIFQGLAPTILGDFADMAGRRLAILLCLVVYIGANIGLALQNSYAALLVLRCLQSTGSSGTVALGAGIVADFATSGERGKYMGLVQLGPMVGPAIAPVLGGILSQFLGWRAIFWFLTILASIYLILAGVSLPETGRNVVGDGSIPPQGWNMSLLNYMTTRKANENLALSRTPSHQAARVAQSELAAKRKIRWPNPLKTIHIILEKDVGLVLFFCGILFTGMYTVMATVPSLFAQIYGFNDLQIGLSFIPFGVSSSIASVGSGYMMDSNYKRVAKKAGIIIDIKRGDDMRHFPIERARIEIITTTIYPGIAAILGYGWALDREAHVAVPLILLCFIGFFLAGSFNVLSVLITDLYPNSPATATAANNLVRCFMGAAGTAVIIQMVDGMGRGWCFTLVSGVLFAMSPLLWVDVQWGPRWREARRVRIEKDERDKEKDERENEKGR